MSKSELKDVYVVITNNSRRIRPFYMHGMELKRIDGESKLDVDRYRYPGANSYPILERTVMNVPFLDKNIVSVPENQFFFLRPISKTRLTNPFSFRVFRKG